MEIVDANSGLLTNYEVLEHIKQSMLPSWALYQQQMEELKAIANRPEDEMEEKSPPAGSAVAVPSVSFPVPADISRVEAWRLQSILAPLGPAVWLHHNVASFLSRYPPATQSAARIRSTLSSLQSLQRRQRVAQLTNSELLQLINLRPLTLVEVHRIVEECEERMGEQDVLALLDCIREGLPDGPMQRKRDEAEDDAAAAAEGGG